LVEWPDRPETFEGFHGADTLIARAALRWERLARVDVAPGLGHSDVTIEAIRRPRLDPDGPPAAPPRPGRSGAVPAPRTHPEAGERLVERVTVPGGGVAALVYARKAG